MVWSPRGGLIITSLLDKCAPTGEHWSSSSESLNEDIDAADALASTNPEKHASLKHLLTNEDFKALIAEVKDTYRWKIATVRRDLKVIASRVDSLEEAPDNTQWYISQL